MCPTHQIWLLDLLGLAESDVKLLYSTPEQQGNSAEILCFAAFEMCVACFVEDTSPAVAHTLLPAASRFKWA